MTTPLDIGNRALEHIGSQSQITSLDDGSVEATAINVLYADIVNMTLREMEPEFARKTTGAVASGGVIVPPWAFSYKYFGDCVRVRQVVPAAVSALDPKPMRWSVQTDPVTPTLKVIFTAIAASEIVYTCGGVPETYWDATFTEAVVRGLASALALAIAGRPDFAKQKLIEAGGIAQGATARDS